jgi:hypothetical protein
LALFRSGAKKMTDWFQWGIAPHGLSLPPLPWGLMLIQSDLLMMGSTPDGYPPSGMARLMMIIPRIQVTLWQGYSTY